MGHALPPLIAPLRAGVAAPGDGQLHAQFPATQPWMAARLVPGCGAPAMYVCAGIALARRRISLRNSLQPTDQMPGESSIPS